MNQKDIYVLGEDDEKAVHLFVKLGMPRNIAKTLLFVSKLDECQAVDIERGADLRQPEVSIAIQELRKRKWVKKKRDLKKEGKGRPIHVYKSTMEISEVLKNLEQEKIEEFEETKKDLTELKNYWTAA